VAIKTILFEGAVDGDAAVAAAREAAIASNLVHRNIVATYSHHMRQIQGPHDGSAGELGVFKMYLIQVQACHISLT
jgi:hypothetical protein